VSNIVIRAHKISKRYRIGSVREYTLRGQVASSFQGMLARQRPILPKTNTIWALKDVSFEVRQGEVLGIVGQNGSGKSTVLKILSRITRPTTGWAGIKGRVGSLLEVGTGFSPELTGRENIYLNGAILGLKRAEVARKFDEIVEFSEIGIFLDTPVKHYSSGMYMRLAFSVASHLTAEILLVDEILAVGDASFRQKSTRRMKDLVQNEGRTIIFISHDAASVAALCNRCIYLEKGSLISEGDPFSR
jgi:lipopolysaccharide transport system ATP-binding protein